jgi:alkyl hydroperoxide reductase subunit AhpF
MALDNIALKAKTIAVIGGGPSGVIAAKCVLISILTTSLTTLGIYGPKKLSAK